MILWAVRQVCAIIRENQTTWWGAIMKQAPRSPKAFILSWTDVVLKGVFVVLSEEKRYKCTMKQDSECSFIAQNNVECCALTEHIWCFLLCSGVLNISAVTDLYSVHLQRETGHEAAWRLTEKINLTLLMVLRGSTVSAGTLYLCRCLCACLYVMRGGTIQILVNFIQVWSQK